MRTIDPRPIFFFGITGDPTDPQLGIDKRLRGTFEQARDAVMGVLQRAYLLGYRRFVLQTWTGHQPGQDKYTSGFWPMVPDTIRRILREVVGPWAASNGCDVEIYQNLYLPSHNSASDRSMPGPRLPSAEQEADRAWAESQYLPAVRHGFRRLWLDEGGSEIDGIQGWAEYLNSIGISRVCVEPPPTTGVNFTRFLDHPKVGRFPSLMLLDFWRRFLKHSALNAVDAGSIECHVITRLGDNPTPAELATLAARGFIVGCASGVAEGTMSSAMQLYQERVSGWPVELRQAIANKYGGVPD